MAVVSCPKCTAGLRVSDGSTATVRCPKCQTTFQPPKPKAAAPAFEVVEEPSPKPAPRPAPPPPPPAAAPKKAFSLDDAVRSADKRPPRDDRDDDDDRDRGRRRREDDRGDEDDRPRGRARRDRDDDDDYDDRRDRRRRDDDDDDDRDLDRDRPRKGSKYGIARPAVLLILISLGFYFGGIALHALFLFLAWVGAVIPNGLVLVTGLLGLVGWVVALVGLGMSIAGPARSRALAIATTAVAFVHLVLAFVVAIDRPSAAFGGNSIAGLSVSNRAERLQDLNKELQKEFQANPNSQRVKDIQAELRESRGDVGRLGDDGRMRWDDLVTDLPRLDSLIQVLAYRSRGFEYYLWSLFAGLFELARLILLGLLLGSLARAAKDDRSANVATFGWIAGAAAVGIAMLVVLLATVMAESAAKDALKAAAGGSPPMPQFGQQPGEFQRQMNDWQQQQAAEAERAHQRVRSIGRTLKNWGAGSELLVYTLHAGALVMPALAAFGVWKSMGRRR